MVRTIYLLSQQANEWDLFNFKSVNIMVRTIYLLSQQANEWDLFNFKSVDTMVRTIYLSMVSTDLKLNKSHSFACWLKK
jgi:hypothetical protein